MQNNSQKKYQSYFVKEEGQGLRGLPVVAIFKAGKSLY